MTVSQAAEAHEPSRLWASGAINFRGQDLNLRPPGYEPGELPLLHPGPNHFRFSIFNFRLPCRFLLLAKEAKSPVNRKSKIENRKLLLPLAAAVALEDPCRGKLPELVADHVLLHVQADEVTAVVNQEGRADELGDD